MLRFDRRLIHHFDWVMLLMLVLVSAMALTNLYSSTWNGTGIVSSVFLKQTYLLG
ncbi:MAG TPA: rod shape-determining protein RodA, partial [Desulfobulbaceae bacterium]|nr:rod shape-determining protein RodA [Desulfobulbaceae bacterium]